MSYGIDVFVKGAAMPEVCEVVRALVPVREASEAHGVYKATTAWNVLLTVGDHDYIDDAEIPFSRYPISIELTRYASPLDFACIRDVMFSIAFGLADEVHRRLGAECLVVEELQWIVRRNHAVEPWERRDPSGERDVADAVLTIQERSELTVRGCSQAELSAFQLERRVRFPCAYLRFLRAAGKDCGSFLLGSDLRFDALDSIRKSADALLEEDGVEPLPGSAFVFCSHQGYQFLFFDLSACPDPEVRYYLEGRRAPEVVAPSFSSWLKKAVADEFPREA